MCDHTSIYVLDICGCKCCSACQPPGDLYCKQCNTPITMQDLTFLTTTPEQIVKVSDAVISGKLSAGSSFGFLIDTYPLNDTASISVDPPSIENAIPEKAKKTRLKASDIHIPIVGNEVYPEDTFMSDSTFAVTTTGNVMRYLIAHRLCSDIYTLIVNAKAVKTQKTRCSRCTMMGHNKANTLCPVRIISDRSNTLYKYAEMETKSKYPVIKTPAPQSTMPLGGSLFGMALPESIFGMSTSKTTVGKGTGFGGAVHEVKLCQVSNTQKKVDAGGILTLRRITAVIESANVTFSAVDFIVLQTYLPVVLTLLRNDSIYDIHLRKELYTELFRFLRALSGAAGVCQMLLLQLDARSVLTEYFLLNQQADTFMKLHSTASSSDAEIDTDVLEILGIAFDISDTYTCICKVSDIYAQPSTTSGASSSYLQQMREISFLEAKIDHCEHSHYLTLTEDPGMSKAKLIAVSKELASMSTSLPLTVDSVIAVRVSDSRMDVMSFLVTGPMDTPYAYGCFIFDLYLPRGYPTGPPLCKLRTTGGGVVRFNPNLYACGKVCLSLLGTWSGPGWVPNVSSILQVIISIQSLIMVSDPYFNEPGYEYQRTSNAGRANSKHYNKKIQGYTMKYAILDHLSCLTKSKNTVEMNLFSDIIRMYYIENRERVLKQVSLWKDDRMYAKIKKRLNKLQ